MAGRTPPLHPAGLPHAHGVLRFCHAVRQHRRGGPARDQLMAMAVVPNWLPDWLRVGFLLNYLPSGNGHGLLAPFS